MQETFNPEPWLGVILTVLTYALPGMVIGLFRSRRPVLLTAMLGVITVPVVLLQIDHLDLLLNLPPSELVKFYLTLLGLGLLLCPAGGFVGQRLGGVSAHQS
jgi:hypothetical protein